MHVVVLKSDAGFAGVELAVHFYTQNSYVPLPGSVLFTIIYHHPPATHQHAMLDRSMMMVVVGGSSVPGGTTIKNNNTLLLLWRLPVYKNCLVIGILRLFHTNDIGQLQITFEKLM